MKEISTASKARIRTNGKNVKGKSEVTTAQNFAYSRSPFIEIEKASKHKTHTTTTTERNYLRLQAVLPVHFDNLYFNVLYTCSTKSKRSLKIMQTTTELNSF